jgi:hypothetical protein
LKNYTTKSKVDRCGQKENPFKGFEVGNMDDSNYDLIDLHKNVVDQITLVSRKKTNDARS